jgi:hypothetical protein
MFSMFNKSQRALASFAFTASLVFGVSIAHGQVQIPAGQVALVQAVTSGHGVDYIEVSSVPVVQLLPDDLQGNQHQKWVVQLANGSRVTCVFNISLSQKIPLQVGSIVSMGGQLVVDHGTDILHWLHQDPNGQRPIGYVDLNGVRYGGLSH